MTTLKNSNTTSVDFNKEVSGLLTDNAHAHGRELKLAVAIHQTPEHFAIADILGGVGYKSKRAAMQASLIKHSPAFASHVDKAKQAGKAASLKSAKGFAAKAESEAANRVVTAAVSMFERALIIGYFLYSGGAIVNKLTDKVINVRFTRAVTVGDAEYSSGLTDKMSRKMIYDEGRKLASSRGLIKAGTPSKSKGVVSTGTQKTITDTAATFAATVASLPAKEKADVSTNANFELMLANSLRARFEADGVINVADVVTFLRKHDALNGVQIDTGKTERAPRAKRERIVVPKADAA